MNKNESKYFNTASKMGDALVELLDKKEFEYITIKDICSIAKVNRSTFYLHYSNTADLLEEVIERLNKSFNDHLTTNQNGDTIIHEKELSDLYLIKDKYLIPYLNFIKDNKNVYKALKNNPNVFKANKTYNKMYNYIFSPIMDRFGLDKKWHKYMMDFYISGLSAIILDWINNDCDIDVNELTELIKGLIIKYDKEKN